MLIRIKPNTFNVVKGKEDYNTLNQALANVTNDVNGLIKDEITGDGVTVRLDFFLGGDYKAVFINLE